jgi:hypothetical protein
MALVSAGITTRDIAVRYVPEPLRKAVVYPAKLSAILAPRQLTSFVLAYSFNRSPIRIRSRAFPTPIWLRPRSTDIGVTYELFTKRELEMRWPLAQQPKTIIDGGANVGYASLAFKRRWPEAYVLAIEPDSANLALLQKNYADLKGFDSLQCGILGSACSLQVRSEQAGSAWGFQFEPHRGRTGWSCRPHRGDTGRHVAGSVLRLAEVRH